MCNVIFTLAHLHSAGTQTCENNADVQAEIGSVIKNQPADIPLCTAAGSGVAGVAIVRCHVHPHLIISISAHQYFNMAGA